MNNIITLRFDTLATRRFRRLFNVSFRDGDHYGLFVTLAEPVEEWVKAEIGGRVQIVDQNLYFSSVSLFFLRESDMIMFKLRWL
jgi:hypothetical protein